MLKRVFLIIVLLLWALVFLQNPTPAHAATITVTTTADDFTNNGNCSLREAIQAANTNLAVDACTAGEDGTTDTITLANGATYTMSLVGAGEDFNATGDFDIRTNTATLDVILDVSGGGTATINGAGLGDRIFHLPQSTTNVTMSNITLTNSNVTGGGGALLNSGNNTITLTNMTFSNNQATQAGGAVSSLPTSSAWTISNSTFTNNSTPQDGGALTLGGTFTITNSTFTNNSGANGGAISASSTGLPKTIQNSTFDNNDAMPSNGGAVNISGGMTTIQGSTITNNTANNLGGAITISSSGNLTLENSTLSGNSANTGANAIRMLAAGTPIISGSTITGNFGHVNDIIAGTGGITITGSIIQDTCNGTINNGGGNIAYPSACGTIPVGGDPLLGALANNGGTTLTYLPQLGSSAINVYSTGCLATDQRGASRPATGSCDAGAVEVTLPANTIQVSTTTDEDNTDGDCSLREAIKAANTNLPVDGCPAGSDGSTDTIYLLSGLTYPISIAGAGEDGNASGDFDIANNSATPDIDFQVANSGTATVDANALDRVFDATASQVIFTGLTITDGNAGGANGGGIFTSVGVITLVNSTVTNNIATNGGAIAGGAFSTINITNGLFDNNTATNGGAISSGGAISINGTTFTNNDATGGGGAINTATSSTRTIQNSTFTTNTALNGGAIQINGTAPLLLQRSTLNGNTATNGGAIIGLPGGVLDLQDSTVSGNSASTDGQAIHLFTATATITNSTITGNTGSGTDLSGSSHAYTLIQSIIEGTCTGTVTDGGNNIAYPSACGPIAAGADPMLGALANNGGFTQTHLPQFGSSVINRYSGCSGTDQRGASRPATGSCDIGAVEVTLPANTIQVSTTTDELNSDGDCSLREAIQAANTNAQVDGCPAGSNVATDTIYLLGGNLYSIGLPGYGENANATGDFDIINNSATTDLAFAVVNAGVVRIDGGALDRVFHVQSATVTMTGFTIQNGALTGSDVGGGIFSESGTVTLTSMTVQNNVGSGGGGMFGLTAGSLTVLTSTFTNNSTLTNGIGGAIGGNVTITITQSTFTNNSAGQGGALNLQGAGIKTITASTFSNNSSTLEGGAISILSSPTSITRSTFNGNSSATSGGAIFAATSANSLSITDSTLSGNSASTNGQAIHVQNYTLPVQIIRTTITLNTGGGSDLNTSTATLNLTNTIIDGTCAGTIIDGGTNLAYPSACGAVVAGADPMLGALANNGGFTQTHIPQFGSAAINRYSGCSGTDQRGGVRPLTGSCDIGSVETSLPANTILVSTTDDEINTDGDCSLREAIQAANTNLPVDGCPAGTNGATDIIFLMNGNTYTLGIAGANEDNNVTGDFDILDNTAVTDIAFQVTNSGTATIDANDLDRIFHTDATSAISITSMTFTDGLVTGGGLPGSGGAIHNEGGALTLTNMTFTSNTADSGGAIYSPLSGNTITITNSTISNNNATASGGALHLGSRFSISGSTISNNTAPQNGALFAGSNVTPKTITTTTFSGNTATGGHGGAITTTNTTLTITNSTISGNSTTGFGGGIYIVTGSNLDMTNSTISGNSAGTNGQAILSENNSNTAILSNVTISNNTGGGSDVVTVGTPTISLRRSIIDGTCSGNISDGGNNLVYPGVCGLVTNVGNPMLLPLANNGGSTQTHLPIIGSPALNAYSSGCPATDQRGTSRPQGASCDIGSVELTSGEGITATPSNTPTNTPTDTPTNTPTETPITPTDTPTDTATDTPSDTPTDTATDTPSNTPTDTPMDTATNTPTETPITPTDTPTETPITPTVTLTASNTPCVQLATAPVLFSPLHRAHTTDTTPTFNWSGVINAQSYRMMIYLEDRSFEYKKRVFVTTYTLTAAEALVPAKYLWRARTQDLTCSTWSPWSKRNTLFVD